MYTKEKFIEKAKQLYGDQYSYDKVDYIDYNQPVEIYCNYCKKHFWQKPCNHLSNAKACNCEKLVEIIKAGKKLYGNKYSYDKTTYITEDNKIEVFCNDCKKYRLIGYRHFLKGNDCKYCKHKKEFIEKAKQLYGDRYNYDEVDYITNRDRVKIYCNSCKKYFWQAPSNHINKNAGCPYCVSRYSLTTLEFIEESKKVYGENTFDYSQVEGVNSFYKFYKQPIIKTDTTVTLTCNRCKHTFKTNRDIHLYKKAGCKYCKSFDEFVQRAKKTHGDKYEYDITTYTNLRTKTKIYCKKCKRYFWQTPEGHYRRNGCVFCAQSKGEKQISAYLDNKNISYEIEYSFADLKSIKNGKLFFDFYLPEYNMCIEYQGGQHWKDWFGLTNLTLRQKNDQLKRDYCKKNKILLLEINYNEKITDKLKEFFDEHEFI